MSQLNPDELRVESFATAEQAEVGGGTMGCCTGCVSGCGINPTAGYCESKGNTYEYVNCGREDAAL